nr:MAG TPA: intron associated endonuclease [Caudoviricetes sp.]
MININKKYIVYKHTNKINGKIYIGITSQKPNKRWQNGYGYKDNQHFFRAIQKYGWNNFEHEIIYKDLEEEIATNKEQELIKLYNSNNSNFGYNKDNGGKTNKLTEESIEKIRQWHIGRKLSEETKRKISESHKGISSGENNPMYGKHHTKEAKQKMSDFAKSRVGWKHTEKTKKKIGEGNKGKTLSEEARKKISKANTGKKWTEEQKLKLKHRNSIPVVQLTIEGNFVNIYISAAEASRQLGIAAPLITNCCRKKHKQTYGFMWLYADEAMIFLKRS